MHQPVQVLGPPSIREVINHHGHHQLYNLYWSGGTSSTGTGTALAPARELPSRLVLASTS